MKRCNIVLMALLIAGCNTPPPIIGPIEVSPAYKEDTVTASDIKPLPVTWWRIFGDDELDALEQKLLDNSPDLAGSLVRYRQAMAAADVLRAERVPQIDAGARFERSRDGQTTTQGRTLNTSSFSINLGYEVDLWGRVRQRVDAGAATARAAGADLVAVRVALQAQLADTLLALRGIDGDIALLADSEAAYRQALDLVSERHRLGIASGLDTARAELQLESTRSQLKQLKGQRAVLEHAIAALIGADPSKFAVAIKPLPEIVFRPPVSLPSMLLKRRADIVAARERIASAQASASATRTSFFPSLTLSAGGGVQSSEISRLLSLPGRYWALGPTLATQLFDGGRRQAQVESADAQLEELGQQYRAAVIAAIVEVEDQLALMARQKEAIASGSAAAAAAQRAARLAMTRYQQGATSYLEVVTAQTANLQAQREILALNTRQYRSSVQLIRALGGGWSEV